MEALMDREGKQANTTIEKEEMLRQESFPLNDDNQYYELPPASSAYTEVTKRAVEWALHSQSVKNAPDPDQLSSGAVCLHWKWDKEIVIGMAKATICTGQHPAVWKRASRVVMPKPGNDDYTKLRAHHTISLPCCMGKVIEKVVTDVL